MQLCSLLKVLNSALYRALFLFSFIQINMKCLITVYTLNKVNVRNIVNKKRRCEKERNQDSSYNWDKEKLSRVDRIIGNDAK